MADQAIASTTLRELEQGSNFRTQNMEMDAACVKNRVGTQI